MKTHGGLTAADYQVARNAGQMDFLAALDDSVAQAAISSLTQPKQTPTASPKKQVFEPVICHSTLKLSLRERATDEEMPVFTPELVAEFRDEFFDHTLRELIDPATTFEERTGIALWLMMDEDHAFSFKTFAALNGVDTEEMRDQLTSLVKRNFPTFKMPTHVQAMDWRRNIANRIRSKASHNRSFGQKHAAEEALKASFQALEAA